MQDQEGANGVNYTNGATKSTSIKGRGTPKTKSERLPSRTPAVVVGRHGSALERQFTNVIEEHLTSVGLLNESGKVLLGALNQMVPPEGSERALGEYTAQGIRKIAKSLCDLVITKSAITKELYSIARDEK